MPPRERTADDSATLVADLEGGLRIDEHALDEALLEQPELFYRVSKALALKISQRDFAKQALAETEASVDADERIAVAKREEKITETALKNRVQIHGDVVQATRRFQALAADVGQLSALKDAFVSRSYVLKDLVSLHISNYYSGSSNARDTDREKTARADHAKAAMHEARRRER